jgi:predicted amidohydrolase YtcJ
MAETTEFALTRRAFAGAAVAIAPVAAALAKPQARAADTILIDGRIVIGESETVEALAIQDRRISALGRSTNIRSMAGPNTHIVELAGHMVIPGLIDSHIHAIRAGLTYTTEVHWFGARTIAEALARIRSAADRTPKHRWIIVAGGWTEQQFAEARRPTQDELIEASEGHPVYIQFFYGAVLLTPAGFEAIGIGQGDAPAHGLKVERDAGKPTGWLTGDARAISDLFNRLPPPTFAEKVTSTRAFFRELNSLAITGVVDPGGYNMPPEDYDALFFISQNRNLTLRVAYSLCAPRRDQELSDFRALTPKMPTDPDEDLLRFNGIGENVTWAMYNNDNPTEAQKEQLASVLTWAAATGLTATFHWNNDRSVYHLLDVLERVDHQFRLAPLRWSVAHLHDASIATLNRLNAIGVGWLTQDALYFRGEEFVASRGTEAAERAPPLATALKLGLHIGAGTDAHRVMSYNPFEALQWAVDGKTIGGFPTRGAQELLTRAEALQLYTKGSAWFSFDDDRRGTLAVGKFADLAVLTEGYFDVPKDRIRTIRSLLTMVGGRIVYASGAFAAFEDH